MSKPLEIRRSGWLLYYRTRTQLFWRLLPAELVERALELIELESE